MRLNARMLRPLLRRTLQYFVFILVPISIFFVGFLVYVNAGYHNEAVRMNGAQRAQAQNACEMVFSEVRRLAAKLSLENDTRMFMTPNYRDVNSVAQVEKLRGYTMIYRYISGIYIYAENNGMVLSNAGMQGMDALSDSQWLDFVEGDPRAMMMGSYVRRDVYPYLFVFAKPVIVESQNARGAVVITVDLSQINDIVNGGRVRDGAGFYVLDAQRRVLTGQGIKGIYGRAVDDVLGLPIAWPDAPEAYPLSVVADGVAVSVDRSPQLPLYYLSVLSLEHVAGTLPYSFVTVFFVFLASFLASFAVSLVITYKSVLSVRKAVVSVTDPMKANLLEQDLRFMLQDVLHTDQPGEIHDAFTSRLYLLQREQAISLQAQISPHFLYNTLDTISWRAYAELEGKNSVSDSLTTLSDLLRYTLHQNSLVSSVGEELSYLRTYVNLIKLRYSSRFQVRVTLDAPYHDNIAIRFLLQPLVENAVTHGVKPCPERTVDIVISGHAVGDMLVLQVADNGAGITPERLTEVNAALDKDLERMNEDLRQVVAGAGQDAGQQRLTEALRGVADVPPMTHGLGLRNVSTRLRLIFGDAYGVCLRANEGGGVPSEGRLPLAQTKQTGEPNA